MTVAIALAMWLADVVSSHFDGPWRAVILWTVRVVGTGVFFLCFLFGFAFFWDYVERRKLPKTTGTKDTHDAA